MKNQSILFYSRCLLAILAITGTGLEIAKYGIGMLMYYTVLSNLLVAVFAVYMVYAMNKGQNLQDQNFLRIKAGVTMSIMITCVVYHIMLAPLAEHFWRVENLLCHYIVPIYFLLDTIIVDRQRQYKRLDPVWWTSLPLAYMAFGFVNGFFLKIPIPDAKDSPFAYFFLNVPKYGWNYVLTYCAIIFVTYLLFGYVLAGVKSLKPQSFLAKSAPF
ncbi:Pr6Pr family membrane protein [Streptococcus suis]